MLTPHAFLVGLLALAMSVSVSTLSSTIVNGEQISKFAIVGVHDEHDHSGHDHSAHDHSAHMVQPRQQMVPMAPETRPLVNVQTVAPPSNTTLTEEVTSPATSTQAVPALNANDLLETNTPEEVVEAVKQAIASASQVPVGETVDGAPQSNAPGVTVAAAIEDEVAPVTEEPSGGVDSEASENVTPKTMNKKEQMLVAKFNQGVDDLLQVVSVVLAKENPFPLTLSVETFAALETVPDVPVEEEVAPAGGPRNKNKNKNKRNKNGKNKNRNKNKVQEEGSVTEEEAGTQDALTNFKNNKNRKRNQNNRKGGNKKNKRRNRNNKKKNKGNTEVSRPTADEAATSDQENPSAEPGHKNKSGRNKNRNFKNKNRRNNNRESRRSFDTGTEEKFDQEVEENRGGRRKPGSKKNFKKNHKQRGAAGGAHSIQEEPAQSRQAVLAALPTEEDKKKANAGLYGIQQLMRRGDVIVDSSSRQIRIEALVDMGTLKVQLKDSARSLIRSQVTTHLTAKMILKARQVRNRDKLKLVSLEFDPVTVEDVTVSRSDLTLDPPIIASAQNEVKSAIIVSTLSAVVSDSIMDVLEVDDFMQNMSEHSFLKKQ